MALFLFGVNKIFRESLICPDIEFFVAKDNDAVADDEDIEVVFTSNYAEEDVLDSLKELFDDNLLPTLPKLV